MEKQSADQPYSAPVITVIGSLATLTQFRIKRFNASDELTFMGTPIGNGSA